MVDFLTTVSEGSGKAQTDKLRQNGHEEYGEKYRVDRRKLELMLRDTGDETGLTAEVYFGQVMRETSTVIHWPSKLKIGAKSKKDPHIRIAGEPENIKKAKDMVAVRLESKANRVTLKMDVSHTDHSHIIGRRGQSINRVMEDTNCHIHFPDSNRGTTSVEKSNQVSITGQPEGVERARFIIRSMLPLVVYVEIPYYDNVFMQVDSSSPPIQAIQQKYDVTFIVNGRSQIGVIVAVRGSQYAVEAMKEAIICLAKHLTGAVDVTQILNYAQLHLDVAPQHHMFVVGRSARNIREIMEETGAKIDLPSPTLSTRTGVIIISGPIHAVIQARALLVDYLPLLLMFDLKEEEAEQFAEQPERLKQIEDKFMVSITIKPKPKQTSKSLTIKTKEKNSRNLYLTRLQIMGGSIYSPSIQPNLPSDVFLPLSYYSLNPTSTFSPLPSPTPNSDRSESPSSFSHRQTPPPPPLNQGRPPPGFDISRQNRSVSFNDGDYHRKTKSSEMGLGTSVRNAVSEKGSPNNSLNLSSPRRNSEPQTYSDDIWKPASSDVIQPKALGPPSSSSSTVPSGSSRFAFLEGVINARSSQLLDSHGSNQSSSFSSFASASFNLDRCLETEPQKKFQDYERKMILSTEIRSREMVHPEVRIPTDEWSGLHLSKSADFEALRKSELSKKSKEGSKDVPISLNEPKAKPRLLNGRMDRDPSASMQVLSGRLSMENDRDSQNTNQSNDNASTTMSGLDNVLKLYGIDDLSDQFKKLEITSLDVFLTLNKEDLKEAGFEPLGVRKKIENAIEDMKSAKKVVVRNAIMARAINYQTFQPLQLNSQSGRF
ncbi:protein bicaudal C homolog 1-like [Xenia sp. Carnegie-2017]|uniref:protein bicaudal C homolog 1-like n=1 Tax=Xenia sp. Carnegie-2017 TaxID=2897299 RepID=UPI001F049C23|nr:protein bicaudal C homolog 1-like [Xenia sp. Carnegie-2017]